MSEFKYACPVCGQHIKCDSSQVGTVMECPTCFQKITVPQAPDTDDQKLIITGTKVGSERPAQKIPEGSTIPARLDVFIFPYPQLPCRYSQHIEIDRFDKCVPADARGVFLNIGNRVAGTHAARSLIHACVAGQRQQRRKSAQTFAAVEIQPRSGAKLPVQ